MTNKSPKISVIVPVYNAQKFLNRSLNSIANQTFSSSNYEVIIINDGSTDNSLKIIKDFEKKYKNFHVINQKNKGVYYARNVGLKEAKGEYIAFLDSDDFVKNDFLEVLYNLATSTKADICVCGYNLYYFQSKKQIKELFMVSSGMYSSEKMLSILLRDFRMHFYIWNKLFKKSLFLNNNISFPNMCFEDIIVCTQLMYYAKKVAVVNKPYYYYVKHEFSTVKTINKNKFNDYIKSLYLLRGFLKNKNIYKKYKLSFQLYSIRAEFISIKLLLFIHIKSNSYKGFFTHLKKTINLINLCLSKKFTYNKNFCIKIFD